MPSGTSTTTLPFMPITEVLGNADVEDGLLDTARMAMADFIALVIADMPARVDPAAPVFTAPPVIHTAVADSSGVYNMAWSTADDTGSASASVALQVALDAIATKNGGTLLIPGRSKYLVDATLIWHHDLPIAIRGMGARHGAGFRQSAANLFSIQGSAINMGGCDIDIRDLTLWCSIPTRTSAFVIRSPSSVNFVNVQALAEGGSWNIFFDGYDLNSSNFEQFSMQAVPSGDPITNPGPQGTAFQFRGTGANTVNNFRSMTIVGVNLGFDVHTDSTPGAEAYRWEEVTMPLVNIGVQIGASKQSSGYIPPEYKWRGGHIEAFVTCFQATNVAQVHVTEALFYRNGARGAGSGPHIGFIGVNASIISDMMLLTSTAGAMASGAGAIILTSDTSSGSPATTPTTSVRVHDVVGLFTGGNMANLVAADSNAIHCSVKDCSAQGLTGAVTAGFSGTNDIGTNYAY